MSTIMKAKGGVDNRNSYEQRSLNREKRVRELLRVGNENQQILTRITTRKPQYDHAEWEKDWETNQRYMDNISSYPKDWWKKGEDYSDGSPRSSRGGGGGATNRSSRTNDDSRDSSPRQQDKSKNNKKGKRRDEEDEDGNESYSEDEDSKKQSRRREEKKKGKKREEEEDDDDEDEDRDKRRRSEDRKRAGNRSERDKYVDAGKQDSKRKGK